MKKNHKITAFSWPWNTGKSSLIEELNKNWNYKVCKEFARQHLDKVENIKEFQKAILEDERKRLFKLLSYTGDKDILIDRTFFDNLVYLYRIIINWKMWDEFDFGNLADNITDSVDIYDEVILFTEPFRDSEKYKLYNNQYFNILFITTIKIIYWDKVEEYKNSQDYLNHKK